MIKLVYGGKNKIIKHQGKTFHELRAIIRTNFPEVPIDYSLSYLDQDKDEICLNSDEDLVNMLNTTAKLHKVYIKQSLSQTVVIDMERSDYVQPSFEESVKEDKEQDKKQEKTMDFSKKMEEESAEVEQPQVQIDISQVSESVEINKEQIPEDAKIEVKVEEDKESVKDNSCQISIIKEIPKEKLEISEVIAIPLAEQGKRIIDTLEIKPSQFVISRYESDEQFSSKKEEVAPASVEPKRQEPRKEEPSKEELIKATRAKIFGDMNFERKNSPSKEELLVHSVICSKCKDDFGILGIRYQCILCDNFDLCSTCEQEIEHEHPLLKVKKPVQAITKDQIINKFKKELQPEPLVPMSHYVPSINKEEAQLLMKQAKQSYEQGLARSKKLMDQLYYKLSISHKNPYELSKPIAPHLKKVQTVYQKAVALTGIVGISHNEAMRFATQYPHHTSQQIIETYLQMKSYS